MNNLLELAMQMILCLLIAALIGAIIGYLLGKMSKCGKENEYEYQAAQGKKKILHSYEDDTTHLSDKEKEGLTLMSEEMHETEEEKSGEMQAFQKNLEGIEGNRPSVLPSPRNGLPDDLKEISGIGLKIEEALNELGIFHFDQIADWTPENVKWIDNYLVFKGRVDRENWIGQAKLLATGGSTEFSRRQQKK